MTDDSDTPTSPRLESTGDGSHTLFSRRFDQHYHNPNGAVAESRHNFFEKNGLLDDLAGPPDLSILEIGFGTGLNFLLLLDYYRRFDSTARIDYYSVEAYPVDGDTARAFNYGTFLQDPSLAEHLPRIFEEQQSGFNRYRPFPRVTLHLFSELFDEFRPESPGPEADYIFHDPFSPGVNEELWTGEVFRRLAGWSSPGVVLTTYSAASKARGAMAWAGWCVAREQGALGKREMTIASLDPRRLEHLERVDEERLAERYETGDF